MKRRYAWSLVFVEYVPMLSVIHKIYFYCVFFLFIVVRCVAFTKKKSKIYESLVVHGGDTEISFKLSICEWKEKEINKIRK